jgi:hypothetical protein
LDERAEKEPEGFEGDADLLEIWLDPVHDCPRRRLEIKGEVFVPTANAEEDRYVAIPERGNRVDELLVAVCGLETDLLEFVPAEGIAALAKIRGRLTECTS